MINSNIGILELFAGAGGITHGLKLAGLKTLLAIDNWEIALKTNSNNNNIPVLLEDISKISYKKIKQNINNNKIDIIVGGPPCQAFSTIGKRSLNDSRAKLVKEYARIISEIKPEIFIFENVKGFISFNKGNLLNELLEYFDSLGYNLNYNIYNMLYWNVPQKRERLIIIGSKNKKIKIPTQFFNKIWTFEEATSDLPELHYGEEKNFYEKSPENKLQEYYQKNSNELIDYKAANIKNKKLIELLKYLPECKGVHSNNIIIPPHLKPKGGFKDTYKRLCINKPAYTITRNFTSISGHYSIHPFYNRDLTIREGARLQTFPDKYIFNGNKQEKAIQIANAIPPLFIKYLMKEILKNY